ncbi:transposase [Rhodospirillum sp. A1_3_36]|uniref:transposase n=1 Tax=Rhodospirillum sp. A1_3_36 TaxID=3391666 RepID=UPI0039A72805
MRFSDHGKRQVLAAFDGGDITSDAGGVLLRETAERLNLFGRMAACFEDRRKTDQVTHTLASLLAQRVTGRECPVHCVWDLIPCPSHAVKRSPNMIAN